MTGEPTATEIPIRGMDCTECTRHVRHALAGLPGVEDVQVYLAAEKAVIRHTPGGLDMRAVERAVTAAGYQVGREPASPEDDGAQGLAGRQRDITRQALTLFGLVTGAVLFVVLTGEWLGLLETFTARVPWPLWLAAILAGGYPVFAKVLRAARQRQVIAHTLMTVGALAAVAVGEWDTALVVVFFMRVGDYVETLTAERARRAVRDLAALAPQTARRLVDGTEQVVPLDRLQPGDLVVVRPGEQIPADGVVEAGRAAVDQSTLTGEALPVEVEPGDQVFAATLAAAGSLRVRVEAVGLDTSFGHVIRLVEEAEANRSQVQRLADRFSGYYLPLVAGVAVLVLVLRRDPLATVAVLVVACSCAFALATPMAMLASIGAGARRGLLIKGGKVLEALARADVLLIDKTGTLTSGRPQITDIVPLDDLSVAELLALTAAAEGDSEHPLAEAVRIAARERDLVLPPTTDFLATPGLGVKTRVAGAVVEVGSRKSLAPDVAVQAGDELERQGKTTLYVKRDGQVVGVLAAADTLRPEVPTALQAVRDRGIKTIMLLTGDHQAAAAALATPLRVPYRAELSPADKIAIVKAYQVQGQTVVMVGDGVNDAPALAQADVGIAMGAAGSPLAIEAAHVALMADDWSQLPELLAIAHRTMQVVTVNLGFTALYNVLGLALAAAGILPPFLAAAAQSLPDLGIMANSARLLRQ